jgi:hypothetical protein
MKSPQNERLGEEHPWNSYKSQNQQNHLHGRRGTGKQATRREQKKMHIMERLTCFVRRLQNLESPLAPKQFILSKISSRVEEHIYHYVIKIGFRARAPLDEN